MFIFSVGIGVGQGFQPISAFNYGARKYARLRQAYRFTLLLSQGILVAFAVAVMLASGSLIQYFRDDPTVIEIGTRALRLQTVGVLFLPFGMVTEMQMQSTGQKVAASLLAGMRNGLYFIPLLLILSRLRGLAGIQEAQPIAYVLSCFTAIFFAVGFFRTLPKEDQGD
jgi:Na+-driven multidrug efflux pump